MDRKIKTVVILTLILAGLCVSFACVTLWFLKDTPTTPTDDAPLSGVVFQCDPTSVTALSFTFDKGEDGVAELWNYTCEDGVWHWDDSPDIPLSTTGLNTLMEALSSVTANKILRDVTTEQLSTYGLNEPTKAIRIKDTVYGEQAVYFGTFNAYNQMYYVSIGDDTSTVYMISADIYLLFEYPVEAFVTYNDLPGKLSEGQILSLAYTKGETVITISPQPIYEETTGQGDSSIAGYTWTKTQNGQSALIPDNILSNLVSHITQMNYLGCIAIDTTSDTTYGFDKDTATMTLTYLDKAGEQHILTLTLGGKTDYGYYYARPQETNYIMLLGGVSFAQVFEDWTAQS